jgi:hypothetical protein
MFIGFFSLLTSFESFEGLEAAAGVYAGVYFNLKMRIFSPSALIPNFPVNFS